MMTLDTRVGLHCSVKRNVYEDVLKMYRELTVLSKYPIHIEFEDEMAVDQGVTRDMFSAFWDKCFFHIV